MFTEKNKEDFEKWFYNQRNKDMNKIITNDLGCGYDGCSDFYLEANDVFDKLPFSMQQGVYLEYLDSVGYVVEYKYNKIIEKHQVCLRYDIKKDAPSSFIAFSHTLRQEALKEAFKKADELLNNND